MANYDVWRTTAPEGPRCRYCGDEVVEDDGLEFYEEDWHGREHTYYVHEDCYRAENPEEYEEDE